MRWIERLKGALALQPKLRQKQQPEREVVPMEQWDEWAQQLERRQLRHDEYLKRLVQLPQIYMLGWLPPAATQPHPMPFNNHARNMLVLPIFTGVDALRRFAEIQNMDKPLVLSLPPAEAWPFIAAQEVEVVTINAGGPAALSCDIGQILVLAEMTPR